MKWSRWLAGRLGEKGGAKQLVVNCAELDEIIDG
jgi:hypothetical protein